jgi:hypothetical protein
MTLSSSFFWSCDHLAPYMVASSLIPSLLTIHAIFLAAVCAFRAETHSLRSFDRISLLANIAPLTPHVKAYFTYLSPSIRSYMSQANPPYCSAFMSRILTSTAFRVVRLAIVTPMITIVINIAAILVLRIKAFIYSSTIEAY